MQKRPESIECECGCNRSFPREKMVQIPHPNLPGHPIEYIYVLHAQTIYGQSLVPPKVPSLKEKIISWLTVTLDRLSLTN